MNNNKTKIEEFLEKMGYEQPYHIQDIYSYMEYMLLHFIEKRINKKDMEIFREILFSYRDVAGLVGGDFDDCDACGDYVIERSRMFYRQLINFDFFDKIFRMESKVKYETNLEEKVFGLEHILKMIIYQRKIEDGEECDFDSIDIYSKRKYLENEVENE